MFINRLVIKLELKVGGKKFEIPAGNIKNFSVDHTCYGFTASVDWWFVCLKSQSEDEIFAEFVKKDLVEAKLTVDRAYDKVGASTKPLVLQGLVQDKRVLERSFSDLAGEPVLHRRYTIRMADRAAVLWRQHRPVVLYVDKTLKDVVEDNKPKGLKVKHSWAPLKAKHPVLSLGLGVPGSRASFYDYVAWLLYTRHGGLFYDADKDEYELTDSKRSGATTKPNIEDVESLQAHFPATIRHEVNVLNGWSESTVAKKTVANPDKVAGVRRDFLLVSPIAKDLDKRTTLETSRHKAAEPEAHLTFARFPSVTFKPSMIAEFTPDEGFSDKIYQNKKKYRVYHLSIEAHAENQGAVDDDGYDSNSYEVEYRAELEFKSEPNFRLPEFVAPTWPFPVEGKVVSDEGQSTEGTYQAYKNSGSSLEFYKVKVPLYKNQVVVVRFNPNLQNGHFYFPAYKDARVLLSLEFDRAWISRFLDWRPGARLPQNTQGNHILLGKKAKNETSISHVYAEAKPKLKIERTYEKDNQIIEVSEGTILLKTHESSK
ncbi:MAG: hypothetical protein OXU20_02190 [Myxococcales bacterium]|nr:hypothetical protein [Myxococcales bacterium]MDD9969222.1 hypothetical protein [Myxococcales bacterium]